MEIKDLLKMRRLELGLTLAEVAKMVGVSEATVSRWETGNIANMKRSRIALLAKALQVSPSIIMGWEENPQEAPSKIDESFTAKEKKIMLLYRAASEDDKTVIDCVLRKYEDGDKHDMEFSEEIC